MSRANPVCFIATPLLNIGDVLELIRNEGMPIRHFHLRQRLAVHDRLFLVSLRVTQRLSGSGVTDDGGVGRRRQFAPLLAARGSPFIPPPPTRPVAAPCFRNRLRLDGFDFMGPSFEFNSAPLTVSTNHFTKNVLPP